MPRSESPRGKSISCWAGRERKTLPPKQRLDPPIRVWIVSEPDPATFVTAKEKVAGLAAVPDTVRPAAEPGSFSCTCCRIPHVVNQAANDTNHANCRGGYSCACAVLCDFWKCAAQGGL